MHVREGRVEAEVPEQADAGTGDGVFFNPDMELNRDVTVAALETYRDRADDPADTYLDAHAASGIRGARAAANDWDATLADVDPDAVDLSRETLSRNGLEGEVCHRDARALCFDRPGRFEVVDLDPFGTPMPFADAAFRGARGLVCVTATDTAPLCGAHLPSGKRSYSAVPRNTEYHAEMGLRVLLGALARTAARFDVGATPVLSHVSDHYVRTYLELSERATDADAAVETCGHVYHCPECLWRDHDRGLTADPPGDCPFCGSDQVLTAGPLWVGAAHDPEFVAATRANLRADMGTADRADDLLARIGGELHVPTHYDQHRLAKRWGTGAAPMSEVVESLRDAGHEASRTHFGGTTFKTTAGRAAVEDALR